VQRVLMGHSLGSACAALEAINDPQGVSDMLPGCSWRAAAPWPLGATAHRPNSARLAPRTPRRCLPWVLVWPTTAALGSCPAGVCPGPGVTSCHRIRRRGDGVVAGAAAAAGGHRAGV
jgi:hypothetical protein